ncbi:hypothetical protein KY289_016841 [Solanum tuberosum]|nr:hypothetical protein KY289_016841 [Solanum tuberosum]
MERTLACKICEGQANPTARSTRNATNRAKLKMLHILGGKDDNPPDLTTIFFETRKKDNKLVEPEAIEKHAQLEEMVQAYPSLPTIEIVEKCCRLLTRIVAMYLDLEVE